MSSFIHYIQCLRRQGNEIRADFIPEASPLIYSNEKTLPDSSIKYMLQKAERAKACNKIQDIKTAEDMHHAIFSPEGREFLKANPKLWSSLDLFALQNLMGLEGIEFYRDLTRYPLSIERSNTPCVFAFGGSFDGSSVSLHYSDPSQLYKAIVWDVEQLRIHIEAYCMLQLTIIGEMPLIDIIHQGEEAEIFYE